MEDLAPKSGRGMEMEKVKQPDGLAHVIKDFDNASPLSYV